jgi:hypothetical protein
LKNFQSPQGWVSKGIWSAPFCNNGKKISHPSLWRSKLFDRHQIVVVFWMKAKFLIQSPSNTPHHRMATEKWSIAKGVWACAIILEKQPLLSLLNDWENLVAFQW